MTPPTTTAKEKNDVDDAFFFFLNRAGAACSLSLLLHLSLVGFSDAQTLRSRTGEPRGRAPLGPVL